MYVKSDKIKFYPSAYRYYEDGGVSVVTDDEASLNTEYNRTSSIAKVFHSTKGCFVVSDTNDTDLEFFIGGYYVKIENYATNLLTDFSSATDIYANLKTALVTPAPSLGNWKDLYEVVEFEHGYKPLDYKVGNDVEFEGVSFETSANANATFSLQLFTRASTSDSFTVVPTSKFILTLSDILGNTGKSAREEIKTNALLVTTITGDNATFSGDVSANNIGVTNNLTVGGTVKINNSTILVNGSGDFTFDHSLLFTTSKDIGSSTVPVDDLYVNTINLTTKLVPTNNNVVIGASDNKIKTIYASTVDGDTVTASTINLTTSLLPSNSSVTIGSMSDKIDKVFASTLWGLHTFTDKISGISSSSLTINQSYIVPGATGHYIGKSTAKFAGIYATTFYGNLDGNASTATSATSASTATSAGYATSAGSAGYATSAGSAGSATTATNVATTVTSGTIYFVGSSSASDSSSEGLQKSSSVYVENGGFYASNIYASSDRRLKENIKPFEYKKSILDLPIVTFDYKEGSKNNLGCIAQDLQELYPELVNKGEDGFLHIQESKLVYLLMEEVKELKKKVNELKKEA